MGWYRILFPHPLVRVNFTLTSQCYIPEVFKPDFLHHLHGLHAARFQQKNLRPDVTSSVKAFFVPHILHCWLASLFFRSIFKQVCLFNDWITPSRERHTRITDKLSPRVKVAQVAKVPGIHPKPLSHYVAPTCSSGYLQTWCY